MLQAGRLLQQYVADNYSGRLRWIHTHQNNIRAKVYQGSQDALPIGEMTAGKYSFSFSKHNMNVLIHTIYTFHASKPTYFNLLLYKMLDKEQFCHHRLLVVVEI